MRRLFFQTKEQRVYFEVIKKRNDNSLRFYWGDCGILVNLGKGRPIYEIGFAFYPIKFCDYTYLGIDFSIKIEFQLAGLYFRFAIRPECIGGIPF